MHVAGYLSPAEFWAMLDAQDQVVRDSLLEAPVYELADWPGPAMVGEWAFGQGNRGFQYRGSENQPDPVVVVETAAVDNPPLALVNLRIRNQLVIDSIDIEAHLAETPDRLVDTTIDGVPIVLEVWEQSDAWWGLATIRGRAVVVESRGPAPEELVLRQLTDLEPYIQERRALIRRMRNE